MMTGYPKIVLIRFTSDYYVNLSKNFVGNSVHLVKIHSPLHEGSKDAAFASFTHVEFLLESTEFRDTLVDTDTFDVVSSGEDLLEAFFGEPNNV